MLPAPANPRPRAWLGERMPDSNERKPTPADLQLRCIASANSTPCAVRPHAAVTDAASSTWTFFRPNNPGNAPLMAPSSNSYALRSTHAVSSKTVLPIQTGPEAKTERATAACWGSSPVRSRTRTFVSTAVMTGRDRDDFSPRAQCLRAFARESSGRRDRTIWPLVEMRVVCTGDSMGKIPVRLSQGGRGSAGHGRLKTGLRVRNLPHIGIFGTDSNYRRAAAFWAAFFCRRGRPVLFFGGSLGFFKDVFGC